MAHMAVKCKSATRPQRAPTGEGTRTAPGSREPDASPGTTGLASGSYCAAVGDVEDVGAEGIDQVDPLPTRSSPAATSPPMASIGIPAREDACCDKAVIVVQSMRSCTSSVRVNTRRLPGDCLKGKKVYMGGPSWPPSDPLIPGDALNAGRVDARRLLR